MITEKQLRSLIESHFEGTGLFLVELAVKPGNRISVFIDGDQRVSVETCRLVSRYLEGSLDREKEDFDLTVSSAGADRPLKLPRQYRKNLGNNLEIVTASGEKFTGKLQKAGDDGIELEKTPGGKKGTRQEMQIVKLKFDEIKTAKEVISFKK